MWLNNKKYKLWKRIIEKRWKEDNASQGIFRGSFWKFSGILFLQKFLVAFSGGLSVISGIGGLYQNVFLMCHCRNVQFMILILLLNQSFFLQISWKFGQNQVFQPKLITKLTDSMKTSSLSKIHEYNKVSWLKVPLLFMSTSTAD